MWNQNAGRLAQAAAGAVANDRISDLLCGCEANASGFAGRFAATGLDNQIAASLVESPRGEEKFAAHAQFHAIKRGFAGFAGVFCAFGGGDGG